MKFDCGLDWKEKVAAIEGKWQPHFALWPRRVGHRDCRWLEWIERKGNYRGHSYGIFSNSYVIWYWEYRPMGDKND